MSKIKKVFLHNKKFLKSLVSCTGYDFFTTGFPPFPFDVINHMLPLRFRLFQDAYLILDDNNVKGFVALEKERGSKHRINVNKLFLNSNSFEYGEQLINYVTSRYSAMGATTFNIKFDNSYEEMINLLVTNCKFRPSSIEKIYKIGDIKKNEEIPNYFYKFSDSESKQVEELEISCINSFQRNTFQKGKGYFKDSLVSDLDSKTRFKYVFREEESKKIYGYFCIFSLDNKNFIIDLILEQAYSPYFLNIIDFCMREVRKRSSDFSVYLRLNKYYNNFDVLNDIVEREENIEFIKQNIILTKDYYVPVKENEGEGAIFFDALSLKSN